MGFGPLNGGFEQKHSNNIARQLPVFESLRIPSISSGDFSKAEVGIFTIRRKVNRSIDYFDSWNKKNIVFNGYIGIFPLSILIGLASFSSKTLGFTFSNLLAELNCAETSNISLNP